MTYKVGANTVIEGSNGFFTNIRFDSYLGSYNKPQQGINYGYTSGGTNPPNVGQNVIQRFPFAASTDNAVDVGDLTANELGMADCSDGDYAWNMGGFVGDGTYIISWPFASSTTNATDSTYDLFEVAAFCQGISSPTHGYTLGAVGGAGVSLTIQKFPFVGLAGNATDVGDLTQTRAGEAGQNSQEYGYATGGIGPATSVRYGTIDRWPFASDVNASYVGLTTQARAYSRGNSSTEYAYNSGGFWNPAPTPGAVRYNIIDRWPFASGTETGANVGDLLGSIYGVGCQSSGEYAYVCGGSPGPTTENDVIERWPFASAGTNASDVGNLLSAKYWLSGNQF